MKKKYRVLIITSIVVASMIMWLWSESIPRPPRALYPPNLINGQIATEFRVSGPPNAALQQYGAMLLEDGWVDESEFNKNEPGLYIHWNANPCQRAVVTARSVDPARPAWHTILRVEMEYGYDSACS